MRSFIPSSRTSGARSVAAILASILAILIICSGLPALAAVEPFPAAFKIERIAVNGVTLHVRVGGQGPAVVLLHGFADTGDMWAPLAKALYKDHTVIVPDLRGMGLSSQAPGGYDKKNQGVDIAMLMDKLNVQKADLVTHDIGNMVGYALAAQYPDRITKWVVIDAPLPGIGPWDEILKSPMLWHFNFRGPDVDRLVKGRERIYLDRFYNELSADPKAIDEATRNHYAKLYARPGNMPILALGAEKSFGEQQAAIMRDVGTKVDGGIITGSGHWIMEEQPAQTVSKVRAFLDGK
ncbi:MAG: alpha/beta hydrolase [Bradyrhizobiaceae bacterium]|nr:MAG: alpha/beta hydrolase [Bradyrhizobiaceae bacterium]